MTERGLPSMDGAPACPFVAFGDDRDSRATSPDHRHRCFAETPPAPRALAHQEAYCLSSAFPVCPTFQDWARREAAQARADEMRADASMVAAAAATAGSGPDLDDDDAAYPPPNRPPEPPPARNPPRDWAAPPPWATGAGTTSRAGSTGPTANELLAGKAIEGQGLAGSAADQLAGGAPPAAAAAAAAWSASGAGAASTPADHELAGLVGTDPAASAGAGTRATAANPPTPTSTASRPAVSPTRPASPPAPGPSWERPRRYEAYPAIKTRASLPGIPRLGVLAGAIGIAALALFMLPALLGIGGPGPDASGSPSAPIATASAEPTTPPAPTPQVYVIKQGDTLLKVSKRFGITLDDLLAANKETIKNPDKIKIGDEIIIPLPSPEEEPSAPAGSVAP